MGFFRTTGQRFGIAGELFSFFWSNKRWWMTPIWSLLACLRYCWSWRRVPPLRRSFTHSF